MTKNTTIILKISFSMGIKFLTLLVPLKKSIMLCHKAMW